MLLKICTSCWGTMIEITDDDIEIPCSECKGEGWYDQPEDEDGL